MSITPVMPSTNLMLCCPLLLLPSIFPSRRVFSKGPVLCIRWPKYFLYQIHFYIVFNNILYLKVGKTTRPFRYDVNQIPYDYTVEVRNRFKGLDLIGRVPDELWTEVLYIVQETGIKTIPMEKKCKKAKWLPEEAL